MDRMFGEAKAVRRNFINGFMMGGIVGSLMGGLTGTYFAVAHRQISLIPIMMVSSGASFGCIMGIGSLIRAPGPPEG